MQLGAGVDPAADLRVDVGEELELAGECLGQRPRADDEHRCGGVTRRQSARAAARNTNASREHRRSRRAAGRPRSCSDGNGTSSSEMNVMLMSAHDEEPRHLVDRQMAHRLLVAVVQPRELRRHDPDRRREDEHERRPGAASQTDRRRTADAATARRSVAGEHPPQQRLRAVAARSSARRRSAGRRAEQPKYP